MLLKTCGANRSDPSRRLQSSSFVRSSRCARAASGTLRHRTPDPWGPRGDVTGMSRRRQVQQRHLYPLQVSSDLADADGEQHLHRQVHCGEVLERQRDEFESAGIIVPRRVFFVRLPKSSVPWNASHPAKGGVSCDRIR